MRNSLAFRIMFSGLLVGSAALLAASIFLVIFFRAHIEQHFDELLFDHIEEMVAESKFDSDGKLYLKWLPLDPRFHKPRTGWYWEIRRDGEVILHSKSLEGLRLDIVPVDNGKGFSGVRKNGLVLSELKERGSLQIQQIEGPAGERLRAQLLEISFPENNHFFWFVVTGPVAEIQNNVNQFIFQLVSTSLLLFLGLLIAVFSQVFVALKPLRNMRNVINAIHQGKEKRLPGNFPDEVQVVIDELNTLLDHTENLLQRARLNIGNLAHTIKNPLTIIQNEVKKIEGESGELIQKEVLSIKSNLDRYLAQARVAATANLLGSRTDAAKIVEDIRFLMENLYRNKSIQIHVSGLQDCWFRGEAEDLEEMIGNLMDNACKWAVDQVWVHAVSKRDHLLFIIEDNGPGIPENKVNEALQRGTKLNETTAGHGLGLHIVHDIAVQYGGTIKFERSSHGGLSAILELPAA